MFSLAIRIPAPKRRLILYRDVYGPELIYQGYLDRAGALGTLWMGVKAMGGSDEEDRVKRYHPEAPLFAQASWYFLQVIHVFSTQKVRFRSLPNNTERLWQKTSET